MNQSLGERMASQRKANLFKKTILISLLLIFLFIIASLATFYWFIGGTFDKKGQQRNSLPANLSTDDNNYPNRVNILVLGVDIREDDVGRSDTLFLITLDTQAKRVSMLSIPRDTRVSIPKQGWDKINHAFSHGGVNLSKQSIEDLIGIPIDYYASIDFNAFRKIIDSLDGVSVNVEKRMYYEDPYDNLVIDLYPGVQTLNGNKALHYVRYRDEEGDLGRIERQQKFIKALLQKAANPLTLTSLPSIVREITSAVKTNMTTSEILGLAKFLNSAASTGITAETVPGVPVYIDGVNYWVPDVMRLRNSIALVQGLTSDNKWLASSKTHAQSYEKSIPARAIFEEPFDGFDGTNSYPLEQTQNAMAKPAVQIDQDEKLSEKASKTSETVKNPEKLSKKTEKTLSEKDSEKNSSESKPTQSEKNTPKTKPVNKPIESPAQSQKPVAAAKSPIMVNILNASGSSDAGSKMAAAMRREGFEIASISVSPGTNPNTVVIANTGDDSVTGRLVSLPFRYALQINDNAARENHVTVIIGKDFL